jgi:hypothetical protein
MPNAESILQPNRLTARPSGADSYSYLGDTIRSGRGQVASGNLTVAMFQTQAATSSASRRPRPGRTAPRSRAGRRRRPGLRPQCQSPSNLKVPVSSRPRLYFRVTLIRTHGPRRDLGGGTCWPFRNKSSHERGDEMSTDQNTTPATPAPPRPRPAPEALPARPAPVAAATAAGVAWGTLRRSHWRPSRPLRSCSA